MCGGSPRRRPAASWRGLWSLCLGHGLLGGPLADQEHLREEAGCWAVWTCVANIDRRRRRWRIFRPSGPRSVRDFATLLSLCTCRLCMKTQCCSRPVLRLPVTPVVGRGLVHRKRCCLLEKVEVEGRSILHASTFLCGARRRRCVGVLFAQSSAEYSLIMLAISARSRSVSMACKEMGRSCASAPGFFVSPWPAGTKRNSGVLTCLNRVRGFPIGNSAELGIRCRKLRKCSRTGHIPLHIPHDDIDITLTTCERTAQL